MTTYTLLDSSIQNSDPCEYYKFIGPFNDYFYTSDVNQITIDSNEYLPLTILRSPIKGGSQRQTGISLDIKLPLSAQIVKDYAFSSTPKDLKVEIFRKQRNHEPIITIWVGNITIFSVDNKYATFRSPNVFNDLISGSFSNVAYQSICNHILYDSRCGVSEYQNMVVTEVITQADLVITVKDVGEDGNNFVLGQLIIAKNLERRLITSVSNDDLTINYPFSKNIVGTKVELTYGCDHSYATCKSKFSNGKNFGGHPFIPKYNPFEGRL